MERDLSRVYYNARETVSSSAHANLVVFLLNVPASQQLF